MIKLQITDYQEVLRNHNQYRQTGLHWKPLMNFHPTVHGTSDIALTNPF